MTKKELVLQRLREAAGRPVSGQELARELGVSRAAVWKIIRGLEAEGCRITAGPNRGYRLEQDCGLLSEAELRQRLPGLAVSVLRTVDSTNNEAKRRLLAGETRPMLLTAEEQTAGRGRQGKGFYSPAGTGIYLTLVVHPDLPVTDAVSVTTRASVATARAIRRTTGQTPEIKWVNDLYLDGKKICGILVEAISDFETGITKSLLIGVGVNLTTEQFPEGVVGAGALHPQGVTRTELVAAVTEELQKECADLRDRSYLEDYRAWSMVLGKKIVYWSGETKTEALAVGIDDHGGLIVENEAGQRTTLQSGEISVRLDPHGAN